MGRPKGVAWRKRDKKQHSYLGLDCGLVGWKNVQEVMQFRGTKTEGTNEAWDVQRDGPREPWEQGQRPILRAISGHRHGYFFFFN